MYIIVHLFVPLIPLGSGRSVISPGPEGRVKVWIATFMDAPPVNRTTFTKKVRSLYGSTHSPNSLSRS